MPRLDFDCRLRYPAGFELQICFEAGDGITALFGPSGSGKSTILGLIAGLLRPDTGSIHLGGRVLVDRAARVWLAPENRRVGVVFQDHFLFPHLTVRDNLLFGHGRRSSRPIAFERVVEILEIGELLNRKPHSLSGGQRQRVALGRALLRGPELLLMDEPLAALDVSLKDRILTYLEAAVNEWRVPTLFVSHDPADVRRLAANVIIVDKGKLVAAGPTVDKLDRALLSGSPAGAGPVNLLRVTDLCPTGEHWEGRVGSQPLYLPHAPANGSTTAHVRFLPADVVLARETVHGVSIRNQLRGVVRELVHMAGRAFIAVDVGQFLWAQVMPEAVAELGLQPGMEVTCLIKAAAINVLE